MKSLRFLASALALGLLYFAPAHASCAAKDTFTSFVADRFPKAQMTVLGQTDARLFLAAVNRLAHPALAADEIVIADVTGRGIAIPVALFRGGCMSRIGVLPRSMVRVILNSIARNGA